MTVKLAVYDRGVDVSGYRIGTASGAPGNPFKFVMRYSAGAGNTSKATQWKLCEKGEIKKLLALGYDFVANSEWTEDRITEGARAGTADGTADLAFWKSRGLNKGSSIYVSWDTQSSPALYGAVEAYLRAYGAAMGSYYVPDLYGDDKAISAMLARRVIRYGWRSMSDAFSHDGDFYMPGSNWRATAVNVAKVSKAHIWQDGNRAFTGDADENVILRLPIGSHMEQTGTTTPPPKPPTPAPKPVTHIVQKGETLFDIADMWNVTLRQVEAANPHAGHPAGNFDIIYAGDVITHP